MRNVLVYLIALCTFYIYLHNPVLSATGFGTLKFLYCLLPFLMYPQVKTLLKSQQKVLYLFYSIIIFCVIRTLLGGNFTYIYTSITALIEAFIIPIILISLSWKYNFNVIKVLLLVAALSCLITIMSLFMPSFHLWIRGLMIEYELFEKMVYRGYGFSDGLSYAYGIILGLIGGISLPYLHKYKWFIVFLPLLALSIMVNARTGMIIYMGCIGIFLLKNLKVGLKFILYTCILFLILSYTNISLSLSNIAFEEEYTSIFIEEFFNELSDMFLGTDKASFSTSDTLFKEMIVWPNDFIEWLIGSGKNIFLGKKNSDIGFILQLNYGGLVYLFLLIAIVYQLIKQISNKYIKYILMLTFVVANIKGDFILNSGGFRLFIIIVLIYSCNNKWLSGLKS